MGGAASGRRVYQGRAASTATPDGVEIGISWIAMSVGLKATTLLDS
jgi:hypothetical protein